MGLARELKERARDLGFCACRITSAEPFERERAALDERIAAGYFDGMPWFTAERAAVSTDPGRLMTGARAVVSVAMSYARPGSAWQGGARGKIARYAWARDYHSVMKDKLAELRDFLLVRCPETETAVVVDTGRVVDRAAAVRAGLGWYGKNTMLLSPDAGSWVMLGELITTVELETDRPIKKSCGRCTRCLDRCPTGAIVAPGAIDTRRCISYLTIEHRGWIPRPLRPLMGTWIFGCDLCQEVCPVNDASKSEGAAELAPVIEAEPELVPLLALTREEWRARYFSTPVGRAGYAGLLRNVCVALGNTRDPSVLPALTEALDHPEPLVRGHAGWAIGRIGGDNARAAVRAALAREQDSEVVDELRTALESL